MLVPSQEYEGKKKYIEVISLWSYDEFLALIAQILPYSTES